MKISILMPIFNTEPNLVNLCVKSVLNQTHTSWELCIVNDASTKQGLIQLLQSLNDSRIKILNLDKNVGIGIATQKAFELSSGELIAFLDSDDLLVPSALEQSVDILRKRKADMVYSDEDLIDLSGKHTGVHYKCDFAPDILMANNYICHFVVLKREIYEKAGGIRSGFDGSQDHDFLLRATELTKKIEHIPEILYHWRIFENTITHHSGTRNDVWERGVKALRETLLRRNISATVSRGRAFGNYVINRNLTSDPVVSIIIPTIGDLQQLEECINTILKKTTYKNYEIIVVIDQDNTTSYQHLHSKARFLKVEGEFNYSNLLNQAVSIASGSHIITIHDDVNIITQRWIESLLVHSLRSEVGVVGARLLYSNKTIQHAGLIMGLDGLVGYSHKHLPESATGYYLRPFMTQNISAVTGACMMFEKQLYDKIGGFNSNYCIDFSDVDFCLRLRKLGYLNIYTPFCEAFHSEEGRRGLSIDNIIKTGEIKQADSILLKEEYSDIIEKGDPYYNKNFDKHTNFGMVLKKIENQTPNTPPQRKLTRRDPRMNPQRSQLPSPPNLKPIISDTLISIIIPVYQQYPIVIPALLAQTWQNFEAVVVHDGPIPESFSKIINGFNDPRIKLMNTEKVFNDWGHTPRSLGLQHTNEKSKLIVFTGADNYYVPKFLEYMGNGILNKNNAVAAYCNCLHNYWDWSLVSAQLQYGKVDCGCFMIKTAIAKHLGWKHRVHAADWKFIQEVIKAYGRISIIKIDKNLFIHN